RRSGPTDGDDASRQHTGCRALAAIAGLSGSDTSRLSVRDTAALTRFSRSVAGKITFSPREVDKPPGSDYRGRHLLSYTLGGSGPTRVAQRASIDYFGIECARALPAPVVCTAPTDILLPIRRSARASCREISRIICPLLAGEPVACCASRKS